MLHPTYELIRQLVLKNNPQSNLSVIDYGCGTGLLIDLLGKQKIKKYHGFDVSDATLIVARKKYSKEKYFNFSKILKGQVPNFGTKNTVDIIVLIGVLQYMSKDEVRQLFAQAKRVLKNDGQIILSCAVDHRVYKLMNLYQFFIPHSYVNRNELQRVAAQNGFKSSFISEKGVLLAPFISHCLTIFFDGLDKVIFSTKGELGPIGKMLRTIAIPLIKMEYLLPMDYGYTLFAVFKKNGK